MHASLISSGASSSYYVLTDCNSKHFTFKKGLPKKVLYENEKCLISNPQVFNIIFSKHDLNRHQGVYQSQMKNLCILYSTALRQ